MDLASIKSVLDTGVGMALKEYLTVKLNELKNIESLSEKDSVNYQEVELKAQKRAYNKLKEILQDIMTLSESSNKKDDREEYAVGVD